MRRLAALGAILVTAAAVALLVVLTTGGDDGGYRVRAIFDNAFSVIPGEDVKVAGVTVGRVDALEVTPDDRAAITLRITDPGFRDFRADARCTIRPQSLIGERFVECALTEPRAAGAAPAPRLRRIAAGPGAGAYLLPVERTSRPVDLDLVNNISRLPERQRLAIILDELGAGLAGRGADLNATIRRADPALGETNRALRVVADQNRVLRKLAVDADRVLAPLGRDRDRVARFIVRANDVSRATAERRADLERVFARLPRFLSELRPTMLRLGELSGQFEPVLGDLRTAAPDLDRLFRELGPLSRAGIPALTSLGDATRVGRPALVRSKPIVDDLRLLGRSARSPVRNLRLLTESLRDTGGIERLMDFLFFQVSAINGFDSLGHYLRTSLIVNNCTNYALEPSPGCSSNFAARESRDAKGTATAASLAAAAPRRAPGRATTLAGSGASQRARDGLLDFLLGDGR